MPIPFKTTNLLEIYTKLSGIIKKVDSYELSDELEKLRSTYTAMLHYMVKGIDDPNSGKIYSDLVIRSHSLANRAHRLLRIQNQGSDKYTIMQKSMMTAPSFQSICLSIEHRCKELTQLHNQPDVRESKQTYIIDKKSEEHESILITLFNKVWTSDAWNSSDYESCAQLLHSTDIPTTDKCLLVSAVTLAIMEMFDEKKIMLLLDAYDTTYLDVKMRAVVGIVLIMRIYDTYLNISPQIEARLSLLFDTDQFAEDIFMVLMQLQFSKLTDKVSDKMRNDIIPSLLNSGRFQRTKYGLQEIDAYMTQNGENPEWHNGAKDDVAQTKFNEMAELQMEGADLYMSTFVHMKSNAFFYQMVNWFMPFRLDHPSVEKVLSKVTPGSRISNLLTTILLHAPFCDSDKYSFAFMMAQIGANGQEIVAKNLSGGMTDEEMDEQLADIKSTSRKKSDISRQYIQDLYRFFMSYPFHQQFANPFAHKQPSFTPLATKIMKPLLTHEEDLIGLAEFFMRKELYTDALELFMALNPIEIEEDAAIWQKIGFCQQKSGDMEGAFRSYTTAYTLAPDSKWTLKHLARVSFNQKDYSSAELYYDLLLAEDPENLQYLRRKADCLTKAGQYAEAIPLLYKIDYLDDGSTEVKEDLALCHLMTGNNEKAQQIYERLATDVPDSAQAKLNLANVLYLEGEIEKAYGTYRTAYNLARNEENGTKLFKRMFVDAAKRLKPIGLDINKFQMMYDAVVLTEE